MKLTLSVILQSGLVLALAASASAQTGAFGVLTPSERVINGVLVNGIPTALKGQPYSADEITERVQTLADGTRIAPAPQHSLYYRDSAGRTRIERAFAPPPGALGKSPPKLVEITDPVAGYRYSLNETNHTAVRTKFGPSPPLPPGQAAITARRPANAQSAAPQYVVRPVPGAGAQGLKPEKLRESLDPRMIEGVMATGLRVTTTYPIGFFGNDRPLTTVAETWVSLELGRVIESRTSDPRSGESTTRLTNISRAEPDPSLFQIPADYEIRDVSPGLN